MHAVAPSTSFDRRRMSTQTLDDVELQNLHSQLAYVQDSRKLRCSVTSMRQVRKDMPRDTIVINGVTHVGTSGNRAVGLVFRCIMRVLAKHGGIDETRGSSSSNGSRETGRDDNITPRKTEEKPDFIKSKRFKGANKGYVFKMGRNGLGYYKDTFYKKSKRSDNSGQKEAKFVASPKFKGAKKVMFSN